MILEISVDIAIFSLLSFTFTRGQIGGNEITKNMGRGTDFLKNQQGKPKEGGEKTQKS